MFLLPCRKLHVLCEACVGQPGKPYVVCSLDSMTYYKRKPEELQRLTAPVLPTNPIYPMNPSPMLYPNPSTYLSGVDLQ